MLFSEFSRIVERQPQLDFVDIDIGMDFPLYFDPATFLDADDVFSRACADDICDFFEAVMEAVAKGQKQKGIELLAALGEPNDTFLGVSKGRPAGRGVGRKQAIKIYGNIVRSKAADSSLVTDLSDYAMFVDGIGPDKISDMTTNIIRSHLLDYTIDQCDKLEIPLDASVPSGIFWNPSTRGWSQKYIRRPIVDDMPILLVPKRFVKWRGAVSRKTKGYYKHFVRNFIKEEQLRTNGSLVRVVKTKHAQKREVLYKDIEKKFPFRKSFLIEFSEQNPAEYAKFKAIMAHHNPVSDSSILHFKSDDFSETDFALQLISTLSSIDAGKTQAYDYHRFMTGVVQFLFQPDLTNPRVETPINDRRKIIDITYVNAAEAGFFNRMRTDVKAAARWVMVECKNYFDDPKNPEVDQLAMRFADGTRGNFGILLHRNSSKKSGILARCKDVAIQGKGFIIALDDDDVITMLQLIATNARSKVVSLLESRFDELLS